MNDVTTQHARLAVRASDAEREQTVALLQRSFADGRLALAELEERAGAAYAARTRAQLRELTADLPAAAADLPAAAVDQSPPRPGPVLDCRLLCILLCACPPAALAYWLLSARQTAPLRAWRRNARPWQQLLAGAIAAGAGVALQLGRIWPVVPVLSHLAGAVLVSAGVIVALPATSRLLHQARATAPRLCGARLAAPASPPAPLTRP
ncbi:MAG TPA: DUF1707 domain-containing protein, partial [Streptosporangiaceae bacterium]